MRARDTILVTGGAGFVGSHVARAAAEAGSRVVVLDDASGLPPATLVGPHWSWARGWRSWSSGVDLVLGNVGDRGLVTRLIESRRVTAVVHLAGRISVAESVARPELHYDRNVARTIALLDVVREVGPRVFVLSSSAAVYGEPRGVPIGERAELAPISPYGATKLAIEHALAAYARAHRIRWAALRYFNAAGAHPSGALRENHDPETHLVPAAIDAALGRRPPLEVFGDDYPTRDGTCARDYVHVCDLARAHLAAIDALDRGEEVGAVNLGGGGARTVREVIDAVAAVTGREVPHAISPRRPGDPAVLVADVARARAILDWSPTCTDLGTIVEDAARSRR